MADDGMRDLLVDLFAPLGGIAIRRIFGGLGVYRDGLIFAVVVRGVLYLKADAETAPAFAAEGCGPWVYEGADGRVVTMPYHRAPERLYDDPEAALAFAEAALGAARRLEAAKAAGKPGRARRPRA